MTIEISLFDVLSGDAAIAALVGTRIFPGLMPAATTMPAIVWQRIAGHDESALSGHSGLENARVQVSVWAKTRLAARTLAGLTKLALVNDATLRATVLMDMDDYDPDSKDYRVTVDFSIWM